MPLILGEDRLIPGFEANLVGLRPGEYDGLRHHVPGRLPGAVAGRPAGPLPGRRSRSCARRSCPRRTTSSPARMGDYADLAELRADVAQRLERNALDRARHEFSDQIIDYAVANATIDLPDILVDQEVEVMHDEFRTTLARQGIARGGLPQGDRADRGRTCTPSSGRAPSSGPRCSSSCRRSPRPRASTVPDAEVEAQVELRAGSLRGPEDRPLLRVRARTQLHPQHAAPDAGRRDAGGPLAGRPSRASGAAASRGRRAVRRRRARSRGGGLDRRHRSRGDPGCPNPPPRADAGDA